MFVKMLLSALKQASDSVFVDLLTYQDLELLKSRKAGGQAPPPRTQPPNNKRYLIMTYAAEFDRVHYPLPLLYEEHPDPQHLKRIISQLRSEVEALQLEAGSRSGSQVSAELRRLREENSSLRQQIKQLERSGVGPAAPGAGGESGELTRELRAVSSGCVPSHVPHDGQEVQACFTALRLWLRQHAQEGMIGHLPADVALQEHTGSTDARARAGVHQVPEQGPAVAHDTLLLM